MKKRKNYSEEEFEILRKIEENPNITQRQIAQEMELSLGKINFLIKTLMSKGFLKIDNFNRSRNKLGYLYLMTPKGLEKKKKLTMLFLERKAKEFDKLKKEMKHINNL